MLKPSSCKVLIRKILLHAIIAGICISASAQDSATSKKITVKGIIQTTDGTPGPYLSLLLLKAADSSIVKGTITDETGQFTLSSVTPDKYILLVTEMQSRKLLTNLDLTTRNDSIADLGIIKIDKTLKSLEQIIIRGRRPLLVRKIDRLVFDVGNSVLSSGNNMLEVLSRMPGVKVDAAGNVLVNGKSDVMLLIDGKGQYMTREQAQSILGNLRSENVDKVEVLTNPPARYDAQGSAIINVITKKDKIKSDVHSTYGNQLFPAEGINGFDAHFFNLGTNLNYSFSNKVRTFVAADYITTREFRAGFTENMYLYSNNLLRKGRETTNYRETGLNYRAGINIDLTKRIGFDVELNSFGTPRKQYLSQINTAFSSIVQQAQADSFYNLLGQNAYDKNRFTSAVGKFSFALDTLGRNLFVFLDYSQFSNPGDQSYAGSFSYPNTSQTKQEDFNFTRDYKVKIYSFKIDYEHPLAKAYFLEAGVKLASIQNKDRAVLYREIRNGSDPEILQLNNRFNYKELIAGAYVSLRKSISKFNFQAGLRAEYTDSEGRAFDPDATTDRSYLNAFPSLFVQYNKNDNNQFGFSYSRRIVRPNYVDFNPNQNYNSPLSTNRGTLALQPNFSNNLELSYNTKGYYFAVTFSHIKNPRIDLPLQTQDGGVTINNYVTNLQHQNNLLFTAGLPVAIKSWWQTYTSVSLTNANFKVRGGPATSNWWTDVYNNHNFIFNSRHRAEITFSYSSAYWYAYSKTHALANLSVGYRWNVLKDKLDLGININDIAGINKFRITNDYRYQLQVTEAFRNNRYYRISLNYRFNTGNVFQLRSSSSKNDFGEKRY